MCRRIRWKVKLSFIWERRDFYRVKKGQSLAEIAEAFGLPPRLLAHCNALAGEPEEGRILKIPRERRHLYRVRGGESKTLLCGSPESFYERNGTRCLYPGQTVFL